MKKIMELLQNMKAKNEKKDNIKTQKKQDEVLLFFIAILAEVC